MKTHIKSKLFGDILSDGSFNFLISSTSEQSQSQLLKVKSVDIINHSVWTGRRPKEQTEISAFVGRFGGFPQKKTN